MATDWFSSGCETARRGARRLRVGGASLLEALIGLSVAVVMCAVMLPQLHDLLMLRQLQAASADWSRLVQAARHWAFTLNQPVRLELQAGTPACLVLHTGSRGACSGCAAASCRDGAQVLAVSLMTQPGLSASASSASLYWNPFDRTVTPTGTMRLELPDGRALHHVVNLVGRLRLCSPNGLVSGVTPC